MKRTSVLVILFLTCCATSKKPADEPAVSQETPAASARTQVTDADVDLDAAAAVICTPAAIVFRASKIILVEGDKETRLTPANAVDEAIRIGKACPSTELYDDDATLARAEKVHADVVARGAEQYVDHARELNPEGTQGFRPPTPVAVVTSRAELGSLAHLAAGFSFDTQSLARVRFRECEEILSCKTDASSPFFSSQPSREVDVGIVKAESVSFDFGALEIHLASKNCDALDRYLTGPTGNVIPPPKPPPDCTVKTLHHSRDWLIPIRKTDLPVVVDWDR